MTRRATDPWRDVDEEIRHVRGLVLVRRMLAERNATPAELRECDAVIADCRRKLADLTRRAGIHAAAA